ncbi:substrate-binding protein [Rhodococcus koreensis]
MADVALAARHEVPMSAHDLFDLFGAQAGASWLFDARCDAVIPGAPVTLSVPVGPDGGDPIDLLGRISRCIPGRLIEIVHDQPWQGVLTIKLTAVDAGTTRVTVMANLDERGLAWIMRRRGWPHDLPEDHSVHRVGLLTSNSGPGAVYTVACEHLAQLAVDEINTEGGLEGRRVELVVGDDATDPGRAALEARHLVAAGCRVIVASVTSASFEAARRAVGKTGIPLIHPHVNEGGGGGDQVVRWGERPIDQVRAVAHTVMRSAAGRRWYLVGNNYSWAHGAHRAATQAIDEAGGVVVASAQVPLGTGDFTAVLEDVERSGADCVLSCLIGSDEVAFERQVSEAGLRSRWETVSLALDESSRERIGNEAARGIWAVFGYFQDLDTPENNEFLQRYRNRFGRWAPPVSSFSESMYEAFLLYAAAVRSSGLDTSVTQHLYTAHARMPRGLVSSYGPEALRQHLYVARSGTDGFRLITG